VNRATPAGAFIDGTSCVLLVRLLVPAVRALGPDALPDELRPALAAIAAAAEAERAAAATRLRTGPVLSDGWMPTAEYARLNGVSPQAVRKRIARGTLPADRRGRAWVVDPTSP
jgi:hypothetical protein